MVKVFKDRNFDYANFSIEEYRSIDDFKPLIKDLDAAELNITV